MNAHEDLSREKKRIRRELLGIRNGFTDEYIRRCGKELADCIAGSTFYKEAEAVLLYASYGSELSTDMLMERCLDDGKTLFLPKVSGKDMDFFRVSSLSMLVPDGYRGIREPESSTEKFIYPEADKNAIMVMPAVGLSEDGYRLGYGGGFYDRYLGKYSGLSEYTVAVCYRELLLPVVPHDEFDVRPARCIVI
ncbi:MAG: 5-formyltetrahydrofolate cyclo-ligase [Lachnospiraceae bacterium]|nr:5-formyltetrahydrofolate cyclo-ligase [Lachnospiraceae bacterium]